MPRIVIEFEGGSEPTLTGEIDAGAVLGDFCDEHEAAVPFSCKSASCGTCRVVILEGEDLLDAPEDEELEVLDAFGSPPHQRLACVARLRAGSGPLRLRPVRDDE